MMDPEHDKKVRSPSPSDMGIEPETASGPVYCNSDVTGGPDPKHDEIVYASGEEVDTYPEGAYQTWDPRSQEEFGLEEGEEVVEHFFSRQNLLRSAAD